MLKSMTGYGKAQCLLGPDKYLVEIRSVNGKNAEISVKTSLLPKEREMEVRKRIAERLQRENWHGFGVYAGLRHYAIAGCTSPVLPGVERFGRHEHATEPEIGREAVYALAVALGSSGEGIGAQGVVNLRHGAREAGPHEMP